MVVFNIRQLTLQDMNSGKIQEQFVIRLYQISSTHHVVFLKKSEWKESRALTYLLKSNEGKWSPALGQFLFPTKNLKKFFDALKNFEKKYIVKDFQFVDIKKLLTYGVDKQCSQIANYVKWKRVIVYDPLIVKRYEYVINFITSVGKVVLNTKQKEKQIEKQKDKQMDKGKEKQKEKEKEKQKEKEKEKERYKRMLFIYSAKMVKWWVEVFKQAKIHYKEIDHFSMSNQQNYRIKKLLNQENQINLLAYEQLQDYSISRNVLQKYQTIICDDSEIWMNSDKGPLITANDTGRLMRDLLSQCNGLHMDMIFLTAKLPITNPSLMYDICHILRPWQYGGSWESLLVKQNDTAFHNAVWLRKNRYTRELLYILEASGILVNLSPKQPQDAIIERKFCYEVEIHIAERVKSIDSRFKCINRKQTVNSIQADRFTAATTTYSSKSEEFKYIKQLRQACLLAKFPYFTKHLYHLVKEIKQRVVLVIETQQTLEKLVKFLNEQQVQFLVYEINMDEMRKGPSYKFNFSVEPRLCILVRERLLQQYKKCVTECQKETEKQIVAQSLGLQSEELIDFTWYKRRNHNNNYREQEPIQLPKINTAHQIIHFDTFWYDFSEEKQDIIANIFDSPQMFYTNIYGKDGDDLGRAEFRNINFVNNYYICNDKSQDQIYERYKANYNSYKKEKLENHQQEDEGPTLEEFIDNLMKKHEKLREGRQVIEGVYDIDEEFDKYEFEARKQKEKMQAEEDEETPAYVTQIPEQCIQTPCLLELQARLKEKQIQEAPVSTMVELQQPQPSHQHVEWLMNNIKKQEIIEQYESDQESTNSIDLRDYINRERINEHLSDEYLKRLAEVEAMKAQSKRKKGNQSDDSFSSSICLDTKDDRRMEEEKEIEDYIAPKRTKLYIQEPAEVIDVDDNDEDIPLQIVCGQTGNSSHQQSMKFYRSSNQSSFRYPARSQIKPSPRPPKIPGLQIWGTPKGHVKKIIARKYMNLKIMLTPNISFYSNRPHLML